ncbi:hypothetical protein [Streptomyces sp. LBL]|uniref:hypothetical protein n=1 Tax=Streptomyces sp. LBL TaxID=2940562 RepID=UPI0024744B82|nr:hypothetical protein [Streptomyces sp. LBL]
MGNHSEAPVPMATATCTAFRGALEGTGERLGQRVLLERVGFLARLSREVTGTLTAARWDEDCLDVLAAGVDERGEVLPSKGWMALRRLNWPQTVPPPAGVYVSDRVRRGAEEYAARTLRLAPHRRGTSTLCAGCLNTLTHHPAPDRQTERGCHSFLRRYPWLYGNGLPGSGLAPIAYRYPSLLPT